MSASGRNMHFSRTECNIEPCSMHSGSAMRLQSAVDSANGLPKDREEGAPPPPLDPCPWVLLCPALPITPGSISELYGGKRGWVGQALLASPRGEPPHRCLSPTPAVLHQGGLSLPQNGRTTTACSCPDLQRHPLN